MTLEFNRVVEQVYRMGSMLEKLDFDERESLALALARFQQAWSMAAVWERIEWVRHSDVSGYRGAAPLDLPDAEPFNAVYDPPPLPEVATLIAADGSQVYPDELAPVHYYLINIGIYVYHHGVDHTPLQATYPDLKFHKSHVHDRYGRIISNRTVDDRRTVAEMRTLAETAWSMRAEGVPLIALYDNRLMYLPGTESQEMGNLMGEYLGALVHLHDAGATLAGYIDNPFRSKRTIQLLYLLSLQSADEVRAKQQALSRGGDLDGLRDQFFFHVLLKDGQRSAVMVQNSPQNKEFRDKGRNYEIAFFYLKVANGYDSKVVRVDVPVWVARDRQRIDELHALLLAQCRLQGRNPYPYALTRADELAWVSGKDRAKLDELVSIQVRRVRQDISNRTLPPKLRGKELARSPKRYFDIWGEDVIDDR